LFGWIFLYVAPASAEVVSGIEKDSGLQFYEWHRDGVSVRLVQRLPDQTRAFFQGRGFPAEAADKIGRACVFQSIFRNDGKQPVSYDLGDWKVVHQDKTSPLAIRESWEQQWQNMGISKSARIAFRWSLLPSKQRFEPGDYNWGMTAFALPPGANFDLTLLIRIGDRSVTGHIPALRCAADKS